MSKQEIKGQVFKRGHIFYADLGVPIGSEQGGIRPVIIIQNDIGNRHSPTIIVAAITSRIKANLPTHEKINGGKLRDGSIILLEQIRTIDKKRVKEYICNLNDKEMKSVDKALMISLGLAS